MAELVDAGMNDQYLMVEARDVEVRLYCWPCRVVHELALADVEKIVYALGAAEVDAFGKRGMPTDDEVQPYCLREVLRWAGQPEVYLEHVEQGIECREKTPVPEVPYVRPPVAVGAALDAERSGESPYLGESPVDLAIRSFVNTPTGPPAIAEGPGQ